MTDPFAPNCDKDAFAPNEASQYIFGQTDDGLHLVVELRSPDGSMAVFLDRDDFTMFMGRLTRMAADMGFLQ
jgi:hypothetical protein